MNVAVIIPTYNEAQNIAWIVGRVRNSVPQASVLIVDDSSPDGTGEIADGLAADDASVHVLHRAGKEGLGAAYRAGMRWALEHGHDVIVEFKGGDDITLLHAVKSHITEADFHMPL